MTAERSKPDDVEVLKARVMVLELIAIQLLALLGRMSDGSDDNGTRRFLDGVRRSLEHSRDINSEMLSEIAIDRVDRIEAHVLGILERKNPG